MEFGLSNEERRARAAARGCAAYNRDPATVTPSATAAGPIAAAATVIRDAQASVAATAAGENVTHCRAHATLAQADVFRTGFARGSRSLTLHTLAKNFSGCGADGKTGSRGSSSNATRPHLVARACTLQLGVVEYAVELTPHGVALLRQLPLSSAPPAPPAPQPPQQHGDGAAAETTDDDDRYLGDVFVADGESYPGDGDYYSAAAYAYAMLFPAVRVYLRWHMGHATPVPSRLVSCGGNDIFASNVSCAETTDDAKIRDTSLMFMERRAPAATALLLQDRCDLVWRDPMDVGIYVIFPLPAFIDYPQTSSNA